ncbi:hypothetical protein GCM10009624_32400 [Gordonia sinesedis]
MTSSDDAAPTGGQGDRLGPYRLDALIGRGGMGEVYRATDMVKGRVVALKLLAPHLADNEAFRTRFMRESRVAARLNDPHVIPIHDWGEIDDHLFIDMRLVTGRNLREVIDSSGPLPPDRALSIVGQVAGALDAAHADGLVHRDVKPDNILVDDRDFTYLVDFGLAQARDDTRLTSTGEAIGSFGYMAPERFGDGPVGAPADIYALTCVLYECLTGTTPFGSARSVEQLIAAHLNAPPPQLGNALDPVIARGMAKDPAQRFTSAADLVDAARRAGGADAATATTLPPPVFGSGGPPTGGGPVSVGKADGSGGTALPAESVPTQLRVTPPPQPVGAGSVPSNPVPPGSVPPPGYQYPTSPAPERRPLAPIVLGVVVVLLLAVIGVGAWLLVGRDSPTGQASTAGSTSTVPSAAEAPAAAPPPAAETTAGPTAGAPTAVTPTTAPPPAPARGAGDLGLATPITRPACNGTGIVVVGNATNPGTYASEIQGILDNYSGASYLRTDQSCPSLRQSLNGNPIYAVYYVAGQSTEQVCALRARLGGDVYGKWLDTSTDPNFIIPC